MGIQMCDQITDADYEAYPLLSLVQLDRALAGGDLHTAESFCLRLIGTLSRETPRRPILANAYRTLNMIRLELTLRGKKKPRTRRGE